MHRSRQRLPFVLVAIVFLAAAASRIIESLQLPYVFPQGPAGAFYKAVLIGGSIWVVVCVLLLLFDWARGRLQGRSEPADGLYDAELDHFLPPGENYDFEGY